jgi:hypothetical protein
MIRIAVLAIGTQAVAIPSAFAAEPEVKIDPRSPAQKEYAIPHDQGRSVGGGHTGGGGSAPEPGTAPLFGAGLKRAAAPAKQRAKPRTRARAKPRVRASAAAPSTERPSARRVAAVEAPGSRGWLIALLVAVAVVAAGAGTLVAQRRPG